MLADARRVAIREALPLLVPAVPFGFVLGVAISESPMPDAVGVLTSWVILAGAAQLALLTLVSTASIWAAMAAALVINARHVMYSAALAPMFKSQPRWFRWVAPFILIDQVFALAMQHADDEPAYFRRYYTVVGFALLRQLADRHAARAGVRVVRARELAARLRAGGDVRWAGRVRPDESAGRDRRSDRGGSLFRHDRPPQSYRPAHRRSVRCGRRLCRRDVVRASHCNGRCIGVSTTTALFAVLAVGVITYAMRAGLILALADTELPAPMLRALRYVAPAVLAALTVSLLANPKPRTGESRWPRSPAWSSPSPWRGEPRT